MLLAVMKTNRSPSGRLPVRRGGRRQLQERTGQCEKQMDKGGSGGCALFLRSSCLAPADEYGRNCVPDEPAAHRLTRTWWTPCARRRPLDRRAPVEVAGKVCHRRQLSDLAQEAQLCPSRDDASGPEGTQRDSVGDGDYFWIYWPQGKFRYGWEKSGKYAEEYEKYQRKFFMKKRTPVGMHSIGHEVFGYLGVMTIIDPSSSTDTPIRSRPT